MDDQVELYHKEIFEDLINNLTSNQWRVRTSCCLALSDFLRSGGSKVFQVSGKVKIINHYSYTAPCVTHSLID